MEANVLTTGLLAKTCLLYTSSAYKWSDTKGQDGTPGLPGEDGRTPYFHIKYSDNGGMCNVNPPSINKLLPVTKEDASESK